MNNEQLFFSIFSHAIWILGTIIILVISSFDKSKPHLSDLFYQEQIKDLSKHIGWRTDSLREHILHLELTRRNLDANPEVNQEILYALDTEIDRLKAKDTASIWVV